MIQQDVPRDEYEWLRDDLKSISDFQLRQEGERRRDEALKTSPGKLGYERWRAYARELHARGLVEAVDPRIPLFGTERSNRNRKATKKAKPKSFWSFLFD